MSKKELGLLCLGRGVGQSIVIGDNIKITIGQVRNGQVRLQIRAPKDIRVLREEIIKDSDSLA